MVKHNCDRCGVGLVGRPDIYSRAFKVKSGRWELLCGTCVEQTSEQEQTEIEVTNEVEIFRSINSGEVKVFDL